MSPRSPLDSSIVQPEEEDGQDERGDDPGVDEVGRPEVDEEVLEVEREVEVAPVGDEVIEGTLVADALLRLLRCWVPQPGERRAGQDCVHCSFLTF